MQLVHHCIASVPIGIPFADCVPDVQLFCVSTTTCCKISDRYCRACDVRSGHRLPITVTFPQRGSLEAELNIERPCRYLGGIPIFLTNKLAKKLLEQMRHEDIEAVRNVDPMVSIRKSLTEAC